MYYPIIDKLKQVMEEIGQGGTLVINGTLTDDTHGTWTGSFSDIENSVTTNTPVFLSINSDGAKLFLPICYVIPESIAYTSYFPGGYVTIYPNNSFIVTT